MSSRRDTWANITRLVSRERLQVACRASRALKITSFPISLSLISSPWRPAAAAWKWNWVSTQHSVQLSKQHKALDIFISFFGAHQWWPHFQLHTITVYEFRFFFFLFCSSAKHWNTLHKIHIEYFYPLNFCPSNRLPYFFLCIFFLLCSVYFFVRTQLASFKRYHRRTPENL